MKFLLTATLFFFLTVYGSSPRKDQEKFDSSLENDALANCDCTDSASNRNSKITQTEDLELLIENQRLRSEIKKNEEDYSELVADVKNYLSKQQLKHAKEIRQERDVIKNKQDIIYKQEREIRALNADVESLMNRLIKN